MHRKGVVPVPEMTNQTEVCPILQGVKVKVVRYLLQKLWDREDPVARSEVSVVGCCCIVFYLMLHCWVVGPAERLKWAFLLS